MASWVNIMDIIYPVGTFYISNKNTSPSSIIGGTWSQVTNAAIRGVASSTAAGYTGNDSTTLTTNQIPSHGHTFEMNGTIVGWTGSSPGWVCTWDAPGSWGDGYPNGTYKANTNLEQGTRIIGLTGGGKSHTNIQRSYNCYVWYRTA